MCSVHLKSTFLAFIIMFCCRFKATCQDPAETLDNVLNNIRTDIPADQVFLHPDRNLYHPGDTIRFKAYIRDRKTGIICSESISLYALLLDQERQAVDSARFRIINSTASGWLAVPENATAGNYSIVAFTSIMMNYSPDFIFIALVKIQEAGQERNGFNSGFHDSTGHSGRISPGKLSVDLKFLPESGTFIYGIRQRLAFNAVSSEGKVLNVSGEISNQKGDIIARFRSGHYGPGLVEFTPVSGDLYFASLYGQGFTGRKWPLPRPDSSGIAMKVVRSGEQFISIVLEGRGVEDNSYLIAVTMNNSLILAKEVRLDSIRKFGIRTENLPAGTAYITLYNNNLIPVAGRLVFINEQKVLKFEISHSSDSALPEDETELIINPFEGCTDKISALLSVSVIDSVSGYCSSLPVPDIESSFLFDRGFYDNLPRTIKLTGLSNIDKESVDLLLMTYGWRKFRISEFTRHLPEKNLTDYDYFKITGLDNFSKTQKLTLLTLENAGTINIQVNRKRKEAVLNLKELSDSVQQVMILADRINTASLSNANVEFPVNKTFSDSIRKACKEEFQDDTWLQIPLASKKSESLVPEEEIAKIDLPVENVVNIDEVTIKANHRITPPEVFVNKYERDYRSSLVKTVTRKDISMWPSLEFALACLNPLSMDFENKTISFRPSPVIKGDSRALFVLNDIPVGKSYEAIAQIPVSDIESITALKGSMGFTRYGDAANGGIVFITTNKDFTDDHKIANENLMTPIRLYRSDIEFYSPPSDQDDINSQRYRQPAILWKDEVVFNGEDPVRIRIPRGIRNTLMVFINGVTSSNNVGSERIIISGNGKK